MFINKIKRRTTGGMKKKNFHQNFSSSFGTSERLEIGLPYRPSLAGVACAVWCCPRIFARVLVADPGLRADAASLLLLLLFRVFDAAEGRSATE